MTTKGTTYPSRSTIPMPVDFSVTVQLDASGDQTGNLDQEGNIASSLTHNSTGLYTLNLNDRWRGGLKRFNITIIKATLPDAVPFLRGVPDTTVAAATPTLGFGFTDMSANLADPVSCYLLIEGTFKQQTGVPATT